MKHLLWMMIFSGLAAVVFAAVSKGSGRRRLTYGLKVFAEFLVIALVLGWILYFIPFR